MALRTIDGNPVVSDGKLAKHDDCCCVCECCTGAINGLLFRLSGWGELGPEKGPCPGRCDGTCDNINGDWCVPASPVETTGGVGPYCWGDVTFESIYTCRAEYIPEEDICIDPQPQDLRITWWLIDNGDGTCDLLVVFGGHIIFWEVVTHSSDACSDLSSTVTVDETDVGTLPFCDGHNAIIEVVGVCTP